MKTPIRLPILIFLMAVLAAWIQAGACFGEEEKTNQESPVVASSNGSQTEADVVLEEARSNMGDAAAVRQRIERLQSVLDRFINYKYRADLYYYLGLNEQTLGEYDKAIQAFEAALRTEQQIAVKTPIVSYLKAAKNRTLIRTTNIALIVLLIATLCPALWRLLREDAASLPWKRLFFLYLITVAAYSAVILLLPIALGPVHSGLSSFPKPVLSNFRMGQIGDQPLLALLGYGIGAILATLPVVAAASRLRTPVMKYMAAGVGAGLVVGSVMGLYGIRHLFLNAQYNRAEHRLVFLVKSIDSMKDVPDEMLPMYDDNFRKRILDKRSKEK